MWHTQFKFLSQKKNWHGTVGKLIKLSFQSYINLNITFLLVKSFSNKISTGPHSTRSLFRARSKNMAMLFAKIVNGLKFVNSFRKKSSSQMFNRVLNKPLNTVLCISVKLLPFPVLLSETFFSCIFWDC